MRRLEVHLREGETFETVLRAVKASDPVDFFVTQLEQRDRKLITVLVRDGSGQSLMDNLQSCLEGERDWRISLLPVEATVPKPEALEPDTKKAGRRQQATREEIYDDVAAGAKLDRDFLIFVVLSTIVAAVGLNSNSVAGVIGAMVIAPLLGPILGFSLGAALGDEKLLVGSGKTLAVGISVALISAILLSIVMPIDLQSRELVSRAEVRLDGVALAIAAGSAAALSMARGQSAVLVGVMVAAALLPPGAAIGLFIGAGEWTLALRAGLLLALNIACLVFSALLVFRLRRIRPRTWLERQGADRAMAINFGLSAAFLAVAIALIIFLDLGSTVSIG